MRKGNLKKRLQKIKIIVSDVDGTLTDGRIYLDDFGKESKSFFARDGSRMTLAFRAGIKIFFITNRISGAVKERAHEKRALGVLLKSDFKKKSFNALFTKVGVTQDEVMYVGDDLNDIPFMMQVGLKVAVADAAPEVKKIADIITIASGGEGAVAEIIESVLKTQGVWPRLLKNL